MNSNNKHFYLLTNRETSCVYFISDLKDGAVRVSRNIATKWILNFYEFWPPVLDDTRTFNVLKKVLMIIV